MQIDPSNAKPKRKSELVWHVLIILFLIILFFPLVFMISTSFKSLDEIFRSGLNIFPKIPTMDNYIQVFTRNPVFRFILNSLIIAVIVTTAKIITSILASYCLVFMNLKYKDLIFYFFTLTMFVPFSVIMLPNYLTLNKLGLIDSLFGVALPQLADAMGIFRIRQAMRTIPKSLVEAARIDNVGHFTAMIRIVLPLVRPSVVAMLIIFFINSWNEYFWPMLILKTRTNSTITIALQFFLNAEGGSAWGSSMALASIATLIPLILYVFTQRQIMSTFLQSGIKE